MHPDELQRYLSDHIPLSTAIGVKVLAVGEEEVLLGAPLAPNINHRDTVFGGAASAVAILAAWSLVHVRLERRGRTCRIVIQRNTVDYDAPIQGDFTARSSLADPEEWDKFLTMLERRGRARVRVYSVLECDGVEVGQFEGDFVAIDADRLRRR